MTFLIWDANASASIASSRRVLRAAEVPLLEDAQDLVDTLSQRLQQQAEDVRALSDTSRRAGYEEGHAQGLADANAALAEQLLALERDARERQTQRNQEVARLAIAVVGKLLGDWPEPARLAAAATQAAQSLAPVRVLRVHVHPRRLEAARAAAQTSDPMAEHPLRGAEWLADATLAHGACRIETELGSADVGLGDQLARLAAAWEVDAA